MSYKTQAQLAQDESFKLRVAACAAKEGIPGPLAWADQFLWALSATPGFDEAYAYAIGTGVTDPGANEAVITDAAILAAVQPLARPVLSGQVPSH